MEGPQVMSYANELERCKAFLSQDDDEEMSREYQQQLRRVANRETMRVDISLDDIERFDHDLARDIVRNTLRYVEMFSRAIDDLKPDVEPDAPIQETVLDVFIHHRTLLAANNAQQAQTTVEQDRARYPPQLLRRYEVAFVPPPQEKHKSIRQVEASHIGKLVTVEGIVTKATAVKPYIQVATYACDACGCEIYQEVTGPSFMPLTTCTSQDCVTNRRKGRLHLQTRGSKFVKFQELKIQELSRNVPTGHIPRSMTVHAYGENTRVALPGDQVTISGIFLPVPYSGFRQIRAGLLSDTYLLAMNLDKEKKSYSEQYISPEREEEVRDMANRSHIFERLADSLCPEIYGHEEVKKALLLLLVGGVSRNMADGMKIRGDINICLMGDPGVAKSQMLKKISELSPRGVYTTGRGSSGVGLTAAITKDPLTNEMVLEGGALVLSDMGVCCIDEFDKMDDADRTSIHEVMEQQTISIAKAGITTSLNARASILAAANPLYGRYNPRKSATQNINLPAALLSRFDLLFLILDRPDIEQDIRLANHITYVHQHNDYPPTGDDEQRLSKQDIRDYIAVAKNYQPVIPPAVGRKIEEQYAALRRSLMPGKGEAEDAREAEFVTARTLLAILRLASALARLRFSSEVHEDDVTVAIELMDSSKDSLRDVTVTKHKAKRDHLADIYRLVLDLSDRNGRVRKSEAEKVVTQRGYNIDQFQDCLDEYSANNIWQLTTDSIVILDI